MGVISRLGRTLFGQEGEPRYAILVVDMQDYFLRAFKEGSREELIENHVDLLIEANEKSIPVAAVKYGNGPNMQFTEAILETIEEMRTKEIIIKNGDDSFYNTSLERVLRTWSSNSLIIGGVNANACVKDTAETAKKKVTVSQVQKIFLVKDLLKTI